MSVPAILIDPPVTGSRLATARPIVDLPDPDSPTRPRISPLRHAEAHPVDRPERRHPAAAGVLQYQVDEIEREWLPLRVGAAGRARR